MFAKSPPKESIAQCSNTGLGQLWSWNVEGLGEVLSDMGDSKTGSRPCSTFGSFQGYLPFPFFPGIIIFRKPSNTQKKQPVIEKNDVEKNGESTTRQMVDIQIRWGFVSKHLYEVVPTKVLRRAHAVRTSLRTCPLLRWFQLLHMAVAQNMQCGLPWLLSFEPHPPKINTSRVGCPTKKSKLFVYHQHGSFQKASP